MVLQRENSSESIKKFLTRGNFRRLSATMCFFFTPLYTLKRTNKKYKKCDMQKKLYSMKVKEESISNQITNEGLTFLDESMATVDQLHARANVSVGVRNVANLQ